MNEIPFYGTGNLTRDPELSFTDRGTARATASLAINPRRFDPQTRTWVDGTTTYVDCTVWGAQAENLTAALHQGDRVVAIGHWVTSVYTAEQGQRAGQEVRKLSVVIDEIGPSLRFATATPTKTARRITDDAPLPDEPPF
jgi:single-strand DNA-binding protein